MVCKIFADVSVQSSKLFGQYYAQVKTPAHSVWLCR